MRRAVWWEALCPRRVQHPAASRSPAEAPGPSAASRSVAADVRPARTSSRSPKSRPRSCLPAEVSFSRGFSRPGWCPTDPPTKSYLQLLERPGEKPDGVLGENRWAEVTDELSTNQSIDSVIHVETMARASERTHFFFSWLNFRLLMRQRHGVTLFRECARDEM